MSVRFCDFGVTQEGKAVRQAILRNDRIEARVINYGAILTNLILRDRHGDTVDVVLGYPSVLDYQANSGDCMGAVVGRYANRIGGAEFHLDGLEYHLTANDGSNCLHSGRKGFARMLFDMASTAGEPDSVTLTARSADRSDGFPGNVELEVRYSLVGAGLMVRYYATSDAPTVVNITNHSYFNLNGHGSGSVLGHRLCMAADRVLEVDDALIPTGRLLPVAGTPMDFTEEKTLGRDIEADLPLLRVGQGYDHCFAVPDSGLRHFLWLAGPDSGLRMEVLSTLPGVQVYTANFLEPSCPGKDGAAYHPRCAVCLETQDFPDAPNHPDFPDTTLRPEVPYSASTIYRFELAPLT